MKNWSMYLFVFVWTWTTQCYGMPGHRIAGGNEVTPHSYPFTVYMYGYGKYHASFFSGVILNEEWVLSTAGNLQDLHYVEIFIGVHDRLADISPEGESGQGIRIIAKEFYPHEKYDISSGDNNIGLIKLPYPLDLSRENAGAAILASVAPSVGTRATIVGWGDADGGDISFSQVLREDFFALDTMDKCKDSYDMYIADFSDLHCFPNDIGQGVCYGDLGAPAMTPDKTVFGLVTHLSVSGCDSGYPFLAIDLTKHLGFIQYYAGEIQIA